MFLIAEGKKFLRIRIKCFCVLFLLEVRTMFGFFLTYSQSVRAKKKKEKKEKGEKGGKKKKQILHTSAPLRP